MPTQAWAWHPRQSIFRVVNPFPGTMSRSTQLLQQALKSPLRLAVPLSELTTYRIGGPAEMLLETSEVDEVAAAVAACSRLGVPLTVLGAGSNVLAPDEGIAGLVLGVHCSITAMELIGDVLVAPAGTTAESLAIFAADRGITGCEFIHDIPGTVGGCVVQNASNSDGELRRVLLDVRFVDRRAQVVTMAAGELELGYRTSLFKKEWGVIGEARFLVPGRDEPGLIRDRMERFRAVRREKFPLDYPNCGSVFKRPPGDYAGRLIQRAGLGGYRVGDAMVSPKHHGFIINLGQASASDVKAVVAEVQRKVDELFGVKLERELIYLGPVPPVP